MSSTTLSLQQQQNRSDPIPIPTKHYDNEEKAYKDMIKQLTAQAPEPYGAIPPLMKRNKKDKKKKKKRDKKRMPMIRRMSHVENWLALDSKESIPDEEDLKHSSPFRNFLSTDFLVLPLHMPPPSLSATTTKLHQAESNKIPLKNDNKKKQSLSTPSNKIITTLSTTKVDLRPVLFPIKQPPIQVIPIANNEEDEEEDEEEEYEFSEGTEEEEEEEDEEEEQVVEINKNSILNRKRSIPSFSNSQTPSTSTTKSYAMSASPPASYIHKLNDISIKETNNTKSNSNRWLETIAQLRKSLTLSTPKSKSSTSNTTNFIPMPLPPKRNPNLRKKRRSEATTQPRFNPETNTYIRDTRSNPDHLRMISAELNMMRHKKLSSPLKPRGFLPRRTDAFVRGTQRKLSCLRNEIKEQEQDLS